MSGGDSLSGRWSGRYTELLVQGGTVMTPGGAEHVDVACAQGQIVALGDLRSAWSSDTTLDATGLHVLPGVIDSQVHFREPGLVHKENLEAGTRGAVLGGVTAVFEMPNTQPLTLNAADLQAKLDAAHARAWCDYAFYIGGSAVNAEQLAALENLPGCVPVMLDHVHAGRLSLQRLVDLTSAGPARVFGIEGKGRIALGYDADLSIVDLQARRTIHNDWIASISGWTPYDGRAVVGWPIHTVVRGHCVVRDEMLVGRQQGRAVRFLESPLLDKLQSDGA